MTGQVVGDGLHQVNAVDGVDPGKFVGYRPESGYCDDEEGWYFAYKEDGDGIDVELSEVCRVADLSRPETRASGC